METIINLMIGCLIGWAFVWVLGQCFGAKCPKCKSHVPAGATRCSHCREDLAAPVSRPLVDSLVNLSKLICYGIIGAVLISGFLFTAIASPLGTTVVMVVAGAIIVLIRWSRKPQKSAPKKTETPSLDPSQDAWPQDDWTHSVYDSRDKPSASPATRPPDLPDK